MDRREFLKTLALTGAAVTMKWDGVMDIMAQNTSQAGGCDLVAVMGGEPAEMFRKAIAEFGGMGKFVKAGQKVDVKPNIGWDKVPELAGNTNPELVSEIIKQCFDAGARRWLCSIILAMTGGNVIKTTESRLPKRQCWVMPA